MQFRSLGNTGLKVSALSLGTSALGNVFRTIDEEEGIAAVHAAIDHGINLVDSAPAYGALRSETVLGKALRDIPRDRYFLSTKTGKYSNTDFDYRYERIMQEVEKSMKRLGVDYIDILHLHDIEFRNGIFREQALTEGYRALQELQRQGKVRFIGIGIYFIEWCREIMYSHDIQAMICHNHNNLNDDRISSLLPDLKKTGVGLISAAPLAMGLLTSAGPAPWHPASAEDRQIFREAARFCLEAGTPIEQLAVQYSLANAKIPTTLVSVGNRREIMQNITWADQSPDPQLIAEVRNILAPVMNKDWIVG